MSRRWRGLPRVGAEQVIAEADGTMICIVEPGLRTGKRPRDWKEMRLVAARAQDSVTTTYGSTFGSVEETGHRLGHCARDAGWGLSSQIHGGRQTEPNGSSSKPRRSSRNRTPVGRVAASRNRPPWYFHCLASDVVGKSVT
jgi:hypothetical protein